MILSISLRHLANLMTDTITDSNSMRETTLLNLKITNNSELTGLSVLVTGKTAK